MILCIAICKEAPKTLHMLENMIWHIVPTYYRYSVLKIPRMEFLGIEFSVVNSTYGMA